MITVFFVCLLLLYEQVKCSSPLSERINLSGPVLEVKGNKKQTTILLVLVIIPRDSLNILKKLCCGSLCYLQVVVHQC